MLFTQLGLFLGSYKRKKKTPPGGSERQKDQHPRDFPLPHMQKKKQNSGLSRPHLPWYHVDIPGGSHLHLIFFICMCLPFGCVTCNFSF